MIQMIQIREGHAAKKCCKLLWGGIIFQMHYFYMEKEYKINMKGSLIFLPYYSNMKYSP